MSKHRASSVESADSPFGTPVVDNGQAKRTVRFDSSSSEDDEGLTAAPITIHGRGAGAMLTQSKPIPKVSSNLALAHAGVQPLKSTATLATPHVTKESLRYKTVLERSTATVAPPSRPDAPDVEDSLRRISLVLSQHIIRGEKAALGINIHDHTPPSAKGASKDPVGGLAGLLERFAAFTRLAQSRSPPLVQTSTSSTPHSKPYALGKSGLGEGLLREHQHEDDSVDTTGQPKLPETPEELYDAEVEDDEFHESRYLRPEYQVLHSSAGILSSCFQEYTVQPVRYTFTAPSSSEIYSFMKKVVTKAKLTAESCIISLVYVERLMETSRTFLRSHNWRCIVLCGLLLASKVWDDLNSWSVEFAAVYPQFTVSAINTMERLFVSKISFNLYIAGSVYAKYYFALRALNEQKSFRQKYNNMVTGPGAPVAIVRKIEQSTKVLRDSIYSRSF